MLDFGMSGGGRCGWTAQGGAQKFPHVAHCGCGVSWIVITWQFDYRQRNDRRRQQCEEQVIRCFFRLRIQVCGYRNIGILMRRVRSRRLVVRSVVEHVETGRRLSPIEAQVQMCPADSHHEQREAEQRCKRSMMARRVCHSVSLTAIATQRQNRGR
jgi:hypothetical protein